jgi:hypothetical protein
MRRRLFGLVLAICVVVAFILGRLVAAHVGDQLGSDAMTELHVGSRVLLPCYWCDAAPDVWRLRVLS